MPLSLTGTADGDWRSAFSRHIAIRDRPLRRGQGQRQADRSKTYIVRADGSVVASNSGWLFKGHDASIKTGDTIVVPLNTERMPALPLWQSITQILFNLTVAMAAVKTF